MPAAKRPALAEELAALEALGYVGADTPATDRSGVVRHDPARAFAGTNVWSSGHGPEAYEMAMDGTILHTWRRTFAETWPDDPDRGIGTTYWRRVHPLADGHLLAIFEGQGLVRLDRDSRVVWALHERVHHDLEVLPDGRIVTLSHEARVDGGVAILEDFVLELTPDGVVERRTSLLEAVRGSELGRQLWTPRKPKGNLFHTNAIRVLDGQHADLVPAFTAGRVMVSTRAFSAVFVVDLDAGEVVWGHQGPWKRQHDPELLPNGHLLMFDNLGLGRASRVLELDPATLEERWSYRGTPEDPLFSKFCGAAQRLPNGNTLVTDSWVGRAVEVTADGEIVWEYLNPHRSEDGKLVAVLPEMLRVVP